MSATQSSHAHAPSGTVAFVFTDLEGSTERWDRYGVAMRDAVRRHDALVRAAFEARGGYVFKSLGDAFCVAFATVADAVAASVDAQRALAAEDFSAVDGLRMRVGIHVGHADERDGDYFGVVVNRTARLMTIAHGGQTICSEAARALVERDLPPGASLRDAGLHRLKDLAEPERVAEIVVSGLPSTFPPLRSLDAALAHLPIAATPLLGRDDLVRDLARAVEAQRIVSLVGPGGVGKTRTALAVAAEVASNDYEAIGYVELAPVSDGALVANAVVLALGARERSGTSPAQTATDAIGRKRALVILDNCEHVIADAARVAAAIVRACPHATILATTREPLKIAGEVVVRVPTLAIPPANAPLSAADGLRHGAIALFAERASAVNATFALTDANVGIVAEICRRLDGVALAIELAAARTALLPLPRLASMLDERFRLLSGGSRIADPRQQTLQALIGWSYDLLPPLERAVFARVAVFADAFELDDALAVAADERLDAFAVIDALGALVDKSLVTNEADGESQRYDLLESMRAFARDRARESGEAAVCERRRAERMLVRAREIDARWSELSTSQWQRELLPIVADARASLAWAFAPGGDETLGLQLLGALRLYFTSLAPVEGARALEDAAARIEAAPEAIRAPLDLLAAELANDRWNFELALAKASDAKGRFDAVGDRLHAALALRVVALALSYLGRPLDAREAFREALVTFRACDAHRFVAITLDGIARNHEAFGERDDARATFAEALELAARTNYERGKLYISSNFAEFEFACGNVARAIELARANDAHASLVGEVSTRAILFANLAAYESTAGNHRGACEAARTALAVARGAADTWPPYSALQTLAEIAADRGDLATATALLAYVDKRFAELAYERGFTETIGADRLREKLAAAALASDERGRHERSGASLTFARALEIGHAIVPA